MSEFSAVPSDKTPSKLGAVDGAFEVEQFTVGELLALRKELLQSGGDSFQAAEMVSNFLMGRGYGVDSAAARLAAAGIERAGCTAEHIQAELSRVAMVM